MQLGVNTEMLGMEGFKTGMMLQSNVLIVICAGRGHGFLHLELCFC